MTRNLHRMTNRARGFLADLAGMPLAIKVNFALAAALITAGLVL